MEAERSPQRGTKQDAQGRFHHPKARRALCRGNERTQSLSAKISLVFQDLGNISIFELS